ncbi:hypothetical protein Tco_0448325 [Tanacetum coccineum]
MDDPNITMEEYIRLEEEKARREGRTFDWQTARYGKTEYYENEDDSFTDLETEYPTIVFDDISNVAFSREPTVKTDLENENDKVNMLSSPSPEPTIGYFDDLDFLKDFENELPAIVYNDLKSKSDLLNEPSVSSQHIDKFETSLSKYDEKELDWRIRDRCIHRIHPHEHIISLDFIDLALSTYGSEAPVLRFCHGLIAVVSLRRLCHGTLREGDPRKAGGFDIWMSVCFVVLPEHFGFLTVEEASQILDGRHFFGPEVHGRTREARSGMYPILHDVGSDVREVVKEAPIAPGFGRVVDRLKEKEML